jgi:UV DNA damage endonuclease
MRLGLVCISEMLRDEKKLSAKTMTRKGFNALPREAALKLLSARILHNTTVVYATLASMIGNGIFHYRVSSSIFPCVTDATLNIKYDELPDIYAIRTNLRAAGDLARAHAISLSCHPDQFNVLSSYNTDVIDRSIKELNHQSNVLDMMGCAQDLSSPMCLHLNKSPDLKRETVHDYRERFLRSLSRCNAGVRARLVLENEDKGYWTTEQLYRWFGDQRALVYDNLHDQCNPSIKSDHAVSLFRETWHGHTPVFHWSEGTDEKARSHAGRASHVPTIVSANADCIWEVELKDKDYAIVEILNKLL